MSYTEQTWVDGQSGNTPLDAARLQHIEDGLKAQSDRIDSLVSAGASGPGQLQTFSPLWQSASDPQPVLGNATFVASYVQNGHQWHVQYDMLINDTTTVYGTGYHWFTLPPGFSTTKEQTVAAYAGGPAFGIHFVGQGVVHAGLNQMRMIFLATGNPNTTDTVDLDAWAWGTTTGSFSPVPCALTNGVRFVCSGILNDG